jgi:hypothetical protein
VQQPNGPLFKFTLSVIKTRLEGDMIGERDGVVRGHAKVEATFKVRSNRGGGDV